MHAQVQDMLRRKQEAANKLELLQQELSLIQNMNPAEMAALQAEVGSLVQQLTQAEAKKAAFEMQVRCRGVQTLCVAVQTCRGMSLNFKFVGVYMYTQRSHGLACHVSHLSVPCLLLMVPVAPCSLTAARSKRCCCGTR